MLEKKKIYDDLPWLRPHKARLRDSIAADRCPQSLLIVGPPGTGRRDLALWLAETLLGGPVVAAGDDGELEPVHPDFRVVEPPYRTRDGKVIQGLGIDQVREELLPFVALTGHSSQYRVAVLYPAEKLTEGGANGLLKTLEEPPSGAVLILLAETVSSLKPTIVSRCQCIRVVPPPQPEGLAWLSEQVPEQDFSRLLAFSGDAPLAALHLHEGDFADFANGFLGGLDRLEQRALSPAELASYCKNHEELALRLLEWRLAERLRDAAKQRAPTAAEAVGFRQLGQIRELRRVLNGGINAELSLAELLLDWYGGLGHRQD